MKKFHKLLNDKGRRAHFLAIASVNLFKLEKISPFKTVKDSTSNEINDFLVKRNLSVTLHDNLLTFHDSNEKN